MLLLTQFRQFVLIILLTLKAIPFFISLRSVFSVTTWSISVNPQMQKPLQSDYKHVNCLKVVSVICKSVLRPIKRI